MKIGCRLNLKMADFFKKLTDFCSENGPQMRFFKFFEKPDVQNASYVVHKVTESYRLNIDFEDFLGEKSCCEVFEPKIA